MSEDPLEKLYQGIFDEDEKATEEAAKEIIEQNLSPIEAIKILTNAIQEMGEKFAKMEIYLADLIMAANAMTAAMTILQPKLEELEQDIPMLGTIVIGTIRGDLHDIGKNIVSTMLKASGFDVIDLGMDVSLEAFAEAVNRYNPDIIGISALMSTTVPTIKDLVEYFNVLGIRDKCKIMVGGGQVTKAFANQIGADGYAEDGLAAPDEARRLIGKERI